LHKQLDIWLIAIGLTKKSQRYPSPLRSAYYSWFVGEPEITVGQKDRTPDIISTKPNDWLIIDLTLNPNKDLSLFYTDYSNLSSNILADIASPHYKSKSKYKPNLLVIASEQSFNKTKSNRANISGLIVLLEFTT